MDKYDVGIIGAGIAGSCLAILLAEEGESVVVFEKEAYPSHKVCGEFISLESYAFFKSLGLPLDDWNLPIIKNLQLTSQKGGELNTSLKTGGFGLSRYKLDHALAEQMKKSGVHFHPKTKVTEVQNEMISTANGTYKTDLIIGSHGKYSPGYLKRPKSAAKRKYIGVKYHIKGDFKENLISLHSFDGGYCGISKIEDNQYCLCYLADASKLKYHNNNIRAFEKNVLFKNKKLKEVYSKAEFMWAKPLVISNIKFNKQQLHNEHMLFVGDAAGSISPLSGNGMSIAARSALVLSQLILEEGNFAQLRTRYNKEWDIHFGGRVNKAELLNKLMLNPTAHHLVLKALNAFSPLRHKVVNDMQGDSFVRNFRVIR
ncbi:MAG: NAD(P)/FAD-dependent oxidoreductase [Bacteroidia bacterium]|jgi:flavin-dependent dehydrogenase|nr:NAD(P)/FAD-dependent oxidoreductase [Bacteroidia bacterium]